MGSLLWISTMKVLLLSFLALLPLGLTKVRIEYCDACDGDADIGIITCTESGCTVESKLNQTDLSYLTDDPDNPIEDLTPEMCRAKCQQQSEHEGDGKECEFFHWQWQDHEQADKRCSLQTGCPPRSTCDPIAKHCTSGQLGCSDDCQEVSPCSLTKAKWTHDKFHVFCRDPQGGDINIYMDDFNDENIAHGTVCQTVRKCAAWNETTEEKGYYRKLAVFCNGTAIEQGKGSWTVMPDTGNQELSEAMITTTPGKITEQECLATCMDIQLSTYEGQWWTDLICENPLVDNLLTEPNHCVLLCDNNFDKTIDCEFDDKGEKAWRDQTGKKLEDESEIACN